MRMIYLEETILSITEYGTIRIQSILRQGAGLVS